MGFCVWYSKIIYNHVQYLSIFFCWRAWQTSEVANHLENGFEFMNSEMCFLHEIYSTDNLIYNKVRFYWTRIAGFRHAVSSLFSLSVGVSANRFTTAQRRLFAMVLLIDPRSLCIGGHRFPGCFSSSFFPVCCITSTIRFSFSFIHPYILFDSIV